MKLIMHHFGQVGLNSYGGERAVGLSETLERMGLS